MVITFNNYPDNSKLGANLYYSEVSRILKKEKFSYHNFTSIKKTIASLKEEDTLISNIGPYSWIYYYLREKQRNNFRIVSEVQATLWDGYMLQQALCSELIREDDRVLFPSQYARKLFIKLFPNSLNKNNTFVCYPCLSFFPKIKKSSKKERLMLGWAGRLSREKNFDQVLESFIQVAKINKEARLLVTGKADKEFFLTKVRRFLKKNNISPTSYTHLNKGRPISYHKIWNDFYKQVNLLLFPTTSNQESLGRVILEAHNAGCKVIATNHAACPELVPKDNLVPVKYNKGNFDLTNIFPLGYVSVEEMTKKILNHKKLSSENYNHKYKEHNKKLVRILKGEEKTEKLERLNPEVEKFIKNVKVFLNPDFNQDSRDCIKKAIDILFKSNYLDIGETSHKIAMNLKFRPFIKL